MDQNERRIIDDLFAKLQRVDQQAPPRDPEAEALIRRHLAELPGAPYYMAQAIVVQEQALAATQARVEQLERELAARPAGGFLGGLFGGETPRPHGAPGGAHPAQGMPGAPAGSGFMGGALQTALGVAGGVLIANALAGAFAPDAAAAASSPEAFPDADELPEIDDAADPGDFGFDDF
jgi:hypothetical protein